MAAVSLRISTAPDREVEDDLRTIKNKYYTSPENVSFAVHRRTVHSTDAQFCLVTASLRTGGEKRAEKGMKKCLDFIKRSVRSDVPANVFFVIDTHSQDGTGLILTEDENRGARHSLPSECVRDYAGMQFLQAMHSAAELARNAPRNERDLWYDASAFSRGGFRGLFLVTCSPTMKVKRSFEDLRGLVEQCVELASFTLSHGTC